MLRFIPIHIMIYTENQLRHSATWTEQPLDCSTSHWYRVIVGRVGYQLGSHTNKSTFHINRETLEHFPSTAVFLVYFKILFYEFDRQWHGFLFLGLSKICRLDKKLLTQACKTYTKLADLTKNKL